MPVFIAILFTNAAVAVFPAKQSILEAMQDIVLDEEPEPKPRSHWCSWWFSQRNIMMVLYNILTFFVGIRLWALPPEVKCPPMRLLVLVNSIVTVTLCVWWPLKIDVYYGIPRPEPTKGE